MIRINDSEPRMGHVRVAVRGDIVGDGFDRLIEAVDNAIADGAERLLVDTSQTGCIEPAAFQFLLETAEQMAARGGWLKLFNAGPVCKRIIDLTVLETANRMAWAENKTPAIDDSTTASQGESRWVNNEELVTA